MSDDIKYSSIFYILKIEIKSVVLFMLLEMEIAKIKKIIPILLMKILLHFLGAFCVNLVFM